MVAATEPAVSQTLITSASNVRLRGGPAADAAVVTMLPLGTELSTSSADGVEQWIPVQTLRAQAEQGWVDRSLTLPVSAATYPDVVAGLITRRLAREGDGFGARVELLELIEATLRRDWSPEDAARLELQRLHALEQVLHPIPFYRARWDEAVGTWVAGRSAEIRYNEPGGMWLIQRDHILAAHDKHRSTAAADEIAWFAVQNGLAGECEGHLVCHLRWTDMLQGEYLRREPGGRHVEEAAARVEWVVQRFYNEDPHSKGYFSPQEDCGALTALVGSLASAVDGSTASHRTALLQELRALLAPRCPAATG